MYEFFSSNNKRYKGLEKYLADEVLAYGIGEEPYVLDGELLVRNENNEIMRRKDGNGILNKVTLGTASEEEKSRIEMVIWDKIPLYDYRKNECDTQYDFMLSCLLVENNVEPKSHVYPVETYYADSKDDVKRIFRNMVCRGEEGVIVKNKNMHWVNKRSHDAVKMKLSVEVTLKIVDVFEGTGKYAGKLGGFVCESSDGIVNVRIGSGFDDSDRERFYNDFSLVNKCVEIGFNDIVQSKDGTYSLFLPIFKNLREDKDEADSFETIKLAFDMATSLNA